MGRLVGDNLATLLSQLPFEQTLHLDPVVRSEPSAFHEQIGQNSVNPGSPCRASVAELGHVQQAGLQREHPEKQVLVGHGRHCESQSC
jgi:hypothetical protein